MHNSTTGGRSHLERGLGDLRIDAQRVTKFDLPSIEGGDADDVVRHLARVSIARFDILDQVGKLGGREDVAFPFKNARFLIHSSVVSDLRRTVEKGNHVLWSMMGG